MSEIATLRPLLAEMSVAGLIPPRRHPSWCHVGILRDDDISKVAITPRTDMAKKGRKPPKPPGKC